VKPTKAQQLMIDDGLPPSLIIDQSERNRYWQEHPPKSYASPYLEKKIVMTQEQINLLFELKASKDRGAASLGCNSHLAEIAELEKMGYAQQHGFGPTSFYITEAGLVELKKHKKVVKSYEPDSVPTTDKIGITGWAPKGPKQTREPKVADVDRKLSKICTECNVRSGHRGAVLDFLNSKIGKQQPLAAISKAVAEPEGAVNSSAKALMIDLGKKKAKYEIKCVKDTKGVSYGLYAK
jgi:hypothetical protein